MSLGSCHDSWLKSKHSLIRGLQIIATINPCLHTDSKWLLDIPRYFLDWSWLQLLLFTWFSMHLTGFLFRVCKLLVITIYHFTFIVYLTVAFIVFFLKYVLILPYFHAEYPFSEVVMPVATCSYPNPYPHPCGVGTSVLTVFKLLHPNPYRCSRIYTYTCISKKYFVWGLALHAYSLVLLVAILLLRQTKVLLLVFTWQ